MESRFRGNGMRGPGILSAAESSQFISSGTLDRFRFDWTHIVGSIDPVNPVTIYNVEQIHGR